MIFLRLFLLGLGILVQFINAAQVTKVEEGKEGASVSVSVVPANAGDDEGEGFSEAEKKAFNTFISNSELYNYFSSYKLPLAETGKGNRVYHGADEELIANLKHVSVHSYGESTQVNQFLRHERPGQIFLYDELHQVCAEFRASKPSIDPSSFSRSEKFAFINRLEEFGMFVDIDNLKSSSKSSNHKKYAETMNNLKNRAIIAGIQAGSHYCRDALRIVAGVLDARQVTWILKHAQNVITNSSEFLDQLNDFSMFEASAVVESLKFGHYDWFKNEKALKTLTPAALYALFEFLNFDLSIEQLEVLNAARPIKELFESPEFFESPYAWQLVAGTQYFLDEHLNIDGLVEEISKLPDGENFCSDEIRQALVAFYVHSENAINFRVGGIISISSLLPIEETVIPSNIDDLPPINNSNLPPMNLPPPLINNNLPPLPLPLPLNHEEFQISIISQNLTALEFFCTHRSKILSALLKKFKNLDKLDGSLQTLIGLLAVPQIYVMRQAMTLVEGMKSNEFSSEPTVEELLRLLKAAGSDASREYFYRHALVLAYFDLKFAPLRIPYRHIPGSKPRSTLGMAHLFRNIANFKETESSVLSTKWPRLFLFQQAIDFKASQLVQLRDFDGDSDISSIKETLSVILKGFMIFCDHEGFDSYFLEGVKTAFPDHCDAILEVAQIFVSLPSRYRDFRLHFKKNLSSFKQRKKNLADMTNAISDLIILGYFETQIMATIQQLFKPEMADLLAQDTELLNDFCEFAHFLTRAQVKELLATESGRRLLADNRSLVHNLPTYEDVKVTDLKPLKLQAQYATMVRTMPALALLVSLKSDDYILNDPVGLSIRLFSFDLLEFWVQQANSEIINNLWRIVPVQAIVEGWRYSRPDLQRDFAQTLPRIRNFLRNSKEVQGKPFETIRTILHWIILQDLRFLETLTLISTEETEKRRDTLNVLLFMNSSESRDREYLLTEWINSVAMDSNVQERLGMQFMKDLLEVLGGPLSPTRGASYLTARNLMDKNLRFIAFNENYSGFPGWTQKAAETVGLGLSPVRLDKPVRNEMYELVENSCKKVEAKLRKIEEIGGENDKDSDSKDGESNVLFNPTPNENAHTNIPQYRAYIEEDCRVRREILGRLLDEINAVLGAKSDPNAQLWKERIKLLGFLSADGFTLNSHDQSPLEPLNVTLHERIVHRKLLALASAVDTENLPESLSPERLATTIIHFVPRAQAPIENNANSTVAKKSPGKNKKRK